MLLLLAIVTLTVTGCHSNVDSSNNADQATNSYGNANTNNWNTSTNGNGGVQTN